MKRLMMILSLVWAHQVLAQSATTTTTIVSVKVPVEETLIRDRVRALETYDGSRIHALKIVGRSTEYGQYTKMAGEILSSEEISLKSGESIRTSDVEFVYVLREKVTVLKAPGPVPQAVPAPEVSKHPNTDGTTGTNSP